MALQMDPDGAETRALAAATEWEGKKVLEIGCGAGRLTLRLATLGPERIEALDPDPDQIKAARDALPQAEKFRIRYRLGQAESLSYRPGEFDIAVFSWAL